MLWRSATHWEWTMFVKYWNENSINFFHPLDEGIILERVHTVMHDTHHITLKLFISMCINTQTNSLSFKRNLGWFSAIIVHHIFPSFTWGELHKAEYFLEWLESYLLSCVSHLLIQSYYEIIWLCQLIW